MKVADRLLRNNRPVPTALKNRPVQRAPSSQEQGDSQDVWQVLGLEGGVLVLYWGRTI